MDDMTLFWDHTQKVWRPKKLNLTKVPMMFRCPTCAAILVKPKDRAFIAEHPQWLSLDLIGGVCQKCWLAGLGKYGNSLVARMARLELQEQNFVPIHSMEEYNEWKLKRRKKI